MSIQLSDSAAQRVRAQLAARGRGLGLRLGVKASGCSGFSYVVDFADERRPDDLVFTDQGISVYVDAGSLPMVQGTLIDFVRQGLNESFRFENPNATAECGCGESFTVDGPIGS